MCICCLCVILGGSEEVRRLRLIGECMLLDLHKDVVEVAGEDVCVGLDKAGVVGKAGVFSRIEEVEDRGKPFWDSFLWFLDCVLVHLDAALWYVTFFIGNRLGLHILALLIFVIMLEVE